LLGPDNLLNYYIAKKTISGPFRTQKGPFKGLNGLVLGRSILRKKHLIFQFVVVIILGCFLFSTICFLVAESPEEAMNKRRQTPMPPTWEAGVYTRGFYIQWLSLGKHPFLFALSVAGLVISGAISYYLDKRLKRMATELPQPDAD
jgi:hypothetical protein